MDYFLFFLAVSHGLWDLTSQTRDDPRPLAVKAASPNRWTATEFSRIMHVLKMK